MKATPLVSVLVPTYNGARYLDDALRSVRRQSYRNIQVIIRDDGSDDATPDIARAYCARDTRFVFKAPDGRRLGGTGNMSQLLEDAEGEYVKFLHQDDLLAPNCIERLVRPMRFDSTLTLSTSSRCRIDADGESITDNHPAYCPILPHNGKLSGVETVRHAVVRLVNQLGEPSVALFRNGIVSPGSAFTLDGVTYSYINDLALWTNLLMAGDGYWNVEALSSFRVHGMQRSAQLHESVTLADEFADFIRFGVDRSLITSCADFTWCVKHVLSYLGRLASALSAEPAASRSDMEARLSAAVAKMRALVAERAEHDAAHHLRTVSHGSLAS